MQRKSFVSLRTQCGNLTIWFIYEIVLPACLKVLLRSITDNFVTLGQTHLLNFSIDYEYKCFALSLRTKTTYACD